MKQGDIEFDVRRYEVKATEDISGKIDMEFLYRYENGDRVDFVFCGELQFKKLRLKAYPIIKRTKRGAWILTNADVSFWLFEARGTVEDRVKAIENIIQSALSEVETFKTSPLYGKKYVMLTARKQYASETKKEALRQFLERRSSQVRILKGQLMDAENQLRIAKGMWEKEYVQTT